MARRTASTSSGKLYAAAVASIMTKSLGAKLLLTAIESRRATTAAGSGQGDLGILRKWADFFFTSIRQGLRPYAKTIPIRSGVGWVEGEAGKLWGSNQAALSLAIWSTTRRVRQLPPTYNYPLHSHDRVDPVLVKTVFPHLIHLHYHWLFAEKAISANPLFFRSGPLSAGQRAWLRDATPFG